MKTMKLASVAMLAMVGLGFASPASAAVGVDESTATVSLSASNEFKLKAVPNFAFTSTVKDEGKYDINATIPNNTTMKVYRGYSLGQNAKKKVQAKLVSLTYGTSETPETTITSFSSNDTPIGSGTGNSIDLFTDKDFTGTVTGEVNNFTTKITGANIQFTEKKVGPNAQLSGVVQYSIVNA